MAPARRRTGRSKKTPDPAGVTDDDSQGHAAQDREEGGQTQDDKCPACKEDPQDTLTAVEKEKWVRCDACKVWFHWRCVGEGGDLDAVDKWCAPVFIHALCMCTTTLTSERCAAPQVL